MGAVIDANAKLELFRQVVSILDEAGNESSLEEEYSGRGLYGKTVPAIVTDAPAALIGWAFCMALAEQEKIDSEWPADSIGEVYGLIPRRTDNMGLSYVYY